MEILGNFIVDFLWEILITLSVGAVIWLFKHYKSNNRKTKVDFESKNSKNNYPNNLETDCALKQDENKENIKLWISKADNDRLKNFINSSELNKHIIINIKKMIENRNSRLIESHNVLLEPELSDFT